MEYIGDENERAFLQEKYNFNFDFFDGISGKNLALVFAYVNAKFKKVDFVFPKKSVPANYVGEVFWEIREMAYAMAEDWPTIRAEIDDLLKRWSN